MELIKDTFGIINGKTVNLYKLINSNGIELCIIDYGCIITKLCTPDKNGKFENIVLGYNTLEEYISDDKYLGTVCGRVAGRIKNATFKLDDKTYNLTKNDGDNHLHGGVKGLSKVLWDSTHNLSSENAYVTFTYTSPDGEEGYPGTLNIEITYLLNEKNELLISYKGNTNKKTLVNMTNHSYFNLSGNFKKNIMEHTLKLDSDKYLELDHDSTPTGKFINVDNNPFDLRNGSVFKDIFNIIPSGIDHPFLLNNNFDNEIMLFDNESGRKLTIETDQKCVVVYTSNSMPAHLKNIAVCLETQGLPDAINHSNFPQTTIDINETYNAKTKYTFGVI